MCVEHAVEFYHVNIKLSFKIQGTCSYEFALWFLVRGIFLNTMLRINYHYLCFHDNTSFLSLVVMVVRVSFE